jgi:hypothetical protein
MDSMSDFSGSAMGNVVDYKQVVTVYTVLPGSAMGTMDYFSGSAMGNVVDYI